jgi:hypothetical protein
MGKGASLRVECPGSSPRLRREPAASGASWSRGARVVAAGSEAECSAHAGGEGVVGVADVAAVSEESFGGVEERVVAEEVVASGAGAHVGG